MIVIPNCLIGKIEIGGNDECWPFTGHICKDGHGKVTTPEGTFYPHRLMFSANSTEDISDKIVRHSCDNPPCCNPAHLLLGTHDDNVRDRVLRQRSAVGVRNGRAKLTAVDAKEIFLSKESSWVLSKKYSVDPKVIRDIRNRVTWRSTTLDIAQLDRAAVS